MDKPWYLQWAFWLRVLLVVSGLMTLAGQMLDVTPAQVKWLAFGVAAVQLIIGVVGSEPGKSLVGRGVRGLVGK